MIVPVHNTEQYLARCLESIGHQSLQELEILVINDASPGKVREMMPAFMKKDPRIRFLDIRSHAGLFAARLKGIREARGTYLAFVDSDDYISFDYLRALYAMAFRDDADITFGQTVREEGCGQQYTWPVHEAMLPHFCMKGEEARRRFFWQELTVYSWHTVWNKLYHRRIWEKSLPFLESVKRPCVMGEDILFSTVLLFYAERVTGLSEAVYYYCANQGAATDSESMTPSRFRGNIHDLIYVFDEAGRFLEESESMPEYRLHLENARCRYARIWRRLLSGLPFPAGEKRKMRGYLKRLKPSGTYRTGSGHFPQDDGFAESIRQPFGGRFEYLKKRVAYGKEKVVGFDIFGTILERPLESPEDLFLLLEGAFHELGGNGRFTEIRRSAEQMARERAGSGRPSRDDVTLDEIYRVMERNFGLTRIQTGNLMAEEIELERRLLTVRESGRTLLELAAASGKQVVMISDMYLTRSTIAGILEEKGITGYAKIYVSSEYGRLKERGDLFQCVLGEMAINASDLLYIGDNWHTDIEGSRIKGIPSLFLPSCRDAMMNRISGCETGRCGMLGMRGGVPEDIYESAMKSTGYRIMKAMTARRFFDNPYRDFMSGSDLGCDLRLAGYYTGGMHLLGIVRFIDNEVARSGAGCVHFLARDGYLPMKAYELFRQYTGTPVRTGYLHASRRMLMPAILRKEEELAEIPARIESHTPKSMTELLSFAFEGDREDFAGKLSLMGIPWDRPFKDDSAFRRYMALLRSGWYSPRKHQEAIRDLKAYYRVIEEGDLLFDIGYSGRIPDAISFLTGFPVNALFIHDDHEQAAMLQEQGGFRISSMYPHRPRVSGLIREFFLSDSRNGCADPEYPETYGGGTQSVPGKLVIDTWQEEALGFVEDFLTAFGDRLDEIPWSPLEVSLPFEEYLRHMTEPDRQLLMPCRSDDYVYGARRSLSLADLMAEIYRNLMPAGEIVRTAEDTPGRSALMEVLKYHNKPVRALILAAADRDLFKDKLVWNLKNGRDTLRRVIS